MKEIGVARIARNNPKKVAYNTSKIPGVINAVKNIPLSLKNNLILLPQLKSQLLQSFH